MRMLDICCCEGGVSTGALMAGVDEVVGVDIEPQPLYPYEFLQADFTGWDGEEQWFDQFDIIWISPPCQSYSTMSNRHGSKELELIDVARDILIATGKPYVIENVTGARPHMRSPMALHGGQLGMSVYRPRLFESNMILTPPPKAPIPKNPVAVYGRQPGNGRLLWTRNDGSELRAASLDEAREAMEMPWASWNGCREAIPPRYAAFVIGQIVDQLTEVAA